MKLYWFKAQALRRVLAWVFRLAAAAIPVVAVVVAVLRPAPLQPVHEVEGIIGLALETPPILALLAVVTLAGAALSSLAAAVGQA